MKFTDPGFALERRANPGLLLDARMFCFITITSIFEEHNMVIVWADNGCDALRLLQNDQGFDLVYMDIMMPKINVIETIRKIRKMPHLKNLPIVAVTARS